MKLRRALIPVLCCFFTLSGCLQVSTFLSVKPDGSGTLTETFRMNTSFFSRVDSLGAGNGDAPSGSGKKRSSAPFDMQSALKKAESLGKGVSLLSAREISEGTYHGYEAVYAFRDITELQLSRRPDGGKATGAQHADGNRPDLMFRFRKGNPAVLTVILPPQPNDHSPPVQAADHQEQPPGMMTGVLGELFRGMRIAFLLGVEGSILETNAIYRNGSTITLVDIDFDTLLDRPVQFDAFSRLGPDPADEALKQVLDKVPGMKLDVQEKVTVRFRQGNADRTDGHGTIQIKGGKR